MAAKNAIDRFEYRFQSYIYRSIRLCLEDHQGVAATILLCCAVDLLAKFHSGDPDHRLNKKKYVAFLKKYFPEQYDPEGFYSFVRCGLLHSYSMERKYSILCSDKEWARDAHLDRDTKRNTIVINPFELFIDVHKAFRDYLRHIRKDMDAQKAFFAVHRVVPLKRPQVSWKKMKHLRQSPNKS
ncbi:MAG: hypothetical protein ACYTBS_24190 [Planctomycetota bacterium]